MKPFRAPGGRRSSPASTPPRPASSGCCSTSSSSCSTPTPTTSAATRCSPGCCPTGTGATPRLAADYRELTESSLRSGKADDLADRARLAARRRRRGAAGRRPGRGVAAHARNDLRLALGTRLEITEDTEPPDDVADEEDQQLAVYYWLTALQGSLVDALVAGRAGRR